MKALRHFTATRLPNGRVLIAGGIGVDGAALRIGEILNDRGQVIASSRMREARYGHSATALPGGRVLIAGGRPFPGAFLDSMEIFDTYSGCFHQVEGRLPVPRAFHQLVIVPGGVLVIGGSTARWRSIAGVTLVAGEIAPNEVG